MQSINTEYNLRGPKNIHFWNMRKEMVGEDIIRRGTSELGPD